METVVIIIFLIIVWVSLNNKISHISSKIEELTNEVKRLKKLSEPGETKRPEQEIIPETKKTEPIITKKATAEEGSYLKIIAIEETNDTKTKKNAIPPTIQKKTAQPKEKKKKEPINFEKYIGENLFGKIGILVLVIGIGFFVKYAIDKNYINETVRTILGFGVGLVLLFIAWKLKEKYRTYSSLLAGGAFAIFYVTVAMAYHYYGLFSQTVAFIILIAVTLLMTLLASLYDRRELALVALCGGFIAPFLVSSGSGNYLVLFTYVMILDLGMFGLSMYKKWGELPISCFFLTWIVLGGYAFSADLWHVPEIQLIHLLLFCLAFFLIFQLAVASILRINRKRINILLLSIIALNNFAFLGFSMWFLLVMNLEHNYKGIFTLFVAAVNLLLYFWTRRKGENFRFLYQTLLAIALIFVSVTIPIQLEGTFITLFWAAEMVIIMWFYTRYRQKVFEIFTMLLPILTLISLFMDMENAYMGWANGSIFINGMFTTGIFTGLAFLAYAFLQKRISNNNTWPLLIACFILYSSFILDFYLYIDSSLVSRSYMQSFTALVLMGLTYIFRNRFHISLHVRKYMSWAGISILLFVLQSYSINHAYRTPDQAIALQWISLLITGIHLFLLGWMFYKNFDIRKKSTNKSTLYLNILSTIWLLTGTNNLLFLLHLPDETSAGFSIALGMAGFIQMALGMRLHQKTLRLISLGTFGLVLVKLVVIDLWLLPTVGKVIVFIILGIILLVLSFLYQKLKTVLFTDDEITEKTEKEITKLP